MRAKVTSARREVALRAIERNIASRGYHLYVVQQSLVPRYAYTIGLTQSNLAELIMAGCIFYNFEEVRSIIQAIVDRFRSGVGIERTIELGHFGRFSLRKTNPEWTRPLMLGAYDYYGPDALEIVQVVPDESHWTQDTPDLASPGGPGASPVWKWSQYNWPIEAPLNSIVVTNIAALQGNRITEVVRTDMDCWECFAGSGPDIGPEDARVVPLGTVLGIDHSMDKILTLEVGKGLWRDADNGDWNQWG